MKREKLARDYKQLRKEIVKLEKAEKERVEKLNEQIKGKTRQEAQEVNFEDEYKELLKKYMFQKDIMENHKQYVKKYIR